MKLKSLFKMIRSAAVKQIPAGRVSWKYAAYSLCAVMLLFWFGTLFSIPPVGIYDALQAILFTSLIAAASLLLGNLVAGVLNQFQRVAEVYRWILIGTVFLIFNMLNPLFSRISSSIMVIAYLTVFSTFLGAGIGGIRSGEGGKRFSISLVSLGAAGIIAAVLWSAWPGPPYEYRPPSYTGPSLLIEDPSHAGTYDVGSLTYGSGTDRRRIEYASEAALVTPAVDISSMVSQGSAIAQFLRRSYWGFDLTQVPLNAGVWYPKGEGPFPLVLMVHGNHSMFDFSDPGYEYLGQHLASRGYIFASVDQNFLNGAGIAEMLLGRIDNENDARGYLLLEHLSLWHQWNRTEGHQFSGMVDTDKIVLIGHSRGGEAAAVAAAFNHLSAHPDNAMIPFDFGYSIAGVIAFAPSDGQYQPRRQHTALQDINYLVIQGAADGDVRSFSGSRQYERTAFSEDFQGFKASVYIDGANHGQFNTRWGRIDLPAASWMLNRAGIIDPELQRRAAKAYITAFLEAVIQGNREYEKVFRRGDSVQQWMPGLSVLTRFRSSDVQLIADFSEDMNLHTASCSSIAITASGLTLWREEVPQLGSGWYSAGVSARLSWDETSRGQGVYSFIASEDISLTGEADLFFDISHAAESSVPLDFSIRLTDSLGNSEVMSISAVRELPASFIYGMYKPPLKSAFTSEPVFSTYAVPLGKIAGESSTLDLGSIREISFLFDKSSAGDIYLDYLGYVRGETAGQ